MCFGEHYTHGKLPNVLTAYFQYLGLNIMSSTGTLLKKKKRSATVKQNFICCHLSYQAAFQKAI